MKKIITYKQVNSAYRQVQGELEELGLWHDDCKITQTDVIWCRFPQFDVLTAYGFHTDTLGESGSISRFISEACGYEPGHIYIPSVSLSSLFARKQWSLRDVIRHEFGHSVMWHYPELGETNEFYNCFGGYYEGEREEVMGDSAFITDYAKSSPAEDFAECFMWYVRSWKAGVKAVNNRNLAKKWRFVESVIRKLK